jgi:hypothetical protein
LQRSAGLLSSPFTPVIADLKRCGVLPVDDRVLFRGVMYIPPVNAIFDSESTPPGAAVHDFLDHIGIAYIGRYGDWPTCGPTILHRRPESRRQGLSEAI